MQLSQTTWWTLFINQMARIAVDNGQDACTDKGFEKTLTLLLATAQYN